MEEDFSAFSLNVDNPQAIVLGDMGHGFTFSLLNSLFKKMLNGAKLYNQLYSRFAQFITIILNLING